jgi:hypothetical protein
MKNKKVLFLCRYTTLEIDKSINYSVNRKVSGIMSLFHNIGYTCYILKTSDFKYLKNNSKSIHRFNNFILLNYNYKIKYLPRIFNYFFSILINTIKLYFLKKRFNLILFWDFLPDTFIPVYLNKINKDKLIGDIEELISIDPEASTFFKKFELYFLKNYILKKVFLSNKTIYLPSNPSAFVINGFYAESIQEEKYCSLIIDNNFSSSKLRIFYSSRFDENRGINIIIELIKLDIQNNYFIFIICGFGSDEYYNKLLELKKLHKNLEIYYQIERSILIEKLINSDISINLLTNTDFGRSSFPSKLIEYNCLGGLILTNIDYDEIMENSIKISLDPLLIYKKLLELYKLNYPVRNINKNKIEMMKYSLNSKSKDLKRFLND